MRIVFAGAGAVGGYFGGRMAQAGLDVAFLLRPSSARQLRDAGLRVASPLGDFEISRPAVLDGSEETAPAGALFIACKAEHVCAAARLACPFVGSETLVIPLQNGVDAPRLLGEELSPEVVLGGLSRIFAERTVPGEILHMGFRPSIACGEFRKGKSDRVSALVETLAGVEGMEIADSDDIWSEMWKKLLMVCSIGIVGAVARAPLGILLEVPETRALLEAAGREIAAVARAHGAEIGESYAAGQIARYGSLPPETTASMHRDLERGDPSELREQLGAARRYGSDKGVKTPLLDALYGALLPGELRSRGELQFEAVSPRRSS